MKILVVLFSILLLLVFIGCAKKVGKIAFTSDRDGNEEIYVMNDDGTNQINLTKNQASDWYPNWSWDGKRIIFGSFRNPSDEKDEDIYVMNADGSNVEKLTDSPGWSGFASWSPDGSRIAFCSDRDGTQDIYVMNADGTDIMRVTNDPELDYYPSWSSDGSKIVFMKVVEWVEGKKGEPCGPQGGNCEIYVVNVDGTNQVNISNNPAIDGYPSWSPDGTRIAFNRAFYRREKEIVNIFVMNPDGTNVVQLTHQSTVHEPIGGGVAKWSSDGSKIIFQATTDEGKSEIFMINADGTNRVNLTNNSGNDWYAAYSPIW